MKLLGASSYLLLIAAASIGFGVGDWIGPLPDRVYDWDWTVEYDDVTGIRRFHTCWLGLCAAVPVAVIGRFFLVERLVDLLAIPLVAGFAFQLFPYVRHGMFPTAFETLIDVGAAMLWFTIGVFSALGLVFLGRRLGSLGDGRGNT